MQLKPGILLPKASDPSHARPKKKKQHTQTRTLKSKRRFQASELWVARVSNLSLKPNLNPFHKYPLQSRLHGKGTKFRKELQHGGHHPRVGRHRLLWPRPSSRAVRPIDSVTFLLVVTKFHGQKEILTCCKLRSSAGAVGWRGGVAADRRWRCWPVRCLSRRSEKRHAILTQTESMRRCRSAVSTSMTAASNTRDTGPRHAPASQT